MLFNYTLPYLNRYSYHLIQSSTFLLSSTGAHQILIKKNSRIYSKALNQQANNRRRAPLLSGKRWCRLWYLLPHLIDQLLVSVGS